jgi:hypothetical protein
VKQEAAGATRITSRARSSWISQVGQPEERAQLLARQSIEIASRFSDTATAEAVLELMRLADYDSAMLEHALVACRSLARDDPTDQQLTRAIWILRQATTFLGVLPPPFETRKASRDAAELLPVD